MAEPTNSSQNSAPVEAERGSNPRETVLLSDVPDASELLGHETSAPPALTNSPMGSGALVALAGRYDILAEAGHGNMGNVYKARDRETGETVALKLIKPEFVSDQAMMERFKNELLFARKITHKNICRVYDFNRIGGVAYTSMEFVEGESLRSVLNRFKSLSVRKAIDLTMQICSGLKEAHAQGIVHRDLKPENIMIDAQGNVKIMDFGIARSMEAATRLTGAMVGTPGYMAPEQVAGKPVDYRTDIYSVGLVLYEVFTGKPAFVADNPVAVALKQMRESPVAPHEIEPTIPVSIERAILKCIEKEPAKRFQSIAELEQTLTSSGTRAVLSSPVDRPPTLTNREAIAARGAKRVSVIAAPPRSKRVRSLLWVLLGLGTIGTTLMSMHSVKVVKMAQAIPAPSQAAAPQPPAFAFEKPSILLETKKAASPPLRAPEAEPPVAAKPSTESAPRTAEAPAQTVSPPPAASVETQTAPNAANTSPAAVQQRATRAFAGKNSPTDGRGLGYVWVGRFQREDRAQETARKIEDAGLPAVVVPRRNPSGEFFVVLSGPFGQNRLTDVMEQLEEQGFMNLHPLNNLIIDQKLSRP